MQIHPKTEYNMEKNLLPKIKSKFSNIPIKIEDKELEDKEFKEFLKLHYSFDKYKIDAKFNQIKNNRRIDSMLHVAYYMPAKDPYGDQS